MPARVNNEPDSEDKKMRKLFAAAALAAMCTAAAPAAQAQLPVGYTDIGVVLGLGNIGDAGIAPGVRFEKIIKDLPDLGGGTLGIQVGAGYYSYGNKVAVVDWDVTYIPIGATANYHFKFENEKLDAFVGAGLGYQIINCSYNSPYTGSIDYCSNSSLYFIGRIGGRYFFSPKTAFYADAGAGDATLNVGLSFKLR